MRVGVARHPDPSSASVSKTSVLEGEVTGHVLSVPDLGQRRLDLCAYLLCFPTTRSEATT